LKRKKANMSEVLKKLANEPHPAIAWKAYQDAANYLLTGEASEEAVRARIIESMQMPGLRHSEMREAIARGFAAARRAPAPEPPASEPAEEEMPVPKNGMMDARFVARSRRVFAQKRTARTW
jgi:hypothetical protein